MSSVPPCSSNNEEQQQSSTIIKFVPFVSYAEISFWLRYCKEKLNTIKLSTEPIKVFGTYNTNIIHRTSSSQQRQLDNNQPSLLVQESSLILNDNDNNSTTVHQHSTTSLKNDNVQMCGELIGYNTKESFKNVNKNDLLRNWFNKKFFSSNDTCTAAAANKVDLLTSRFLIITYADLKAHKVWYWFGIPSLAPLQEYGPLKSNSTCWLKDKWTEEQCANLSTSIHTMQRTSLPSSCPPYFITATHNTDGKCIELSKDNYNTMKEELQEEDDGRLYFGFFDPSINTTTSTSSAPHEQPIGWPMRNLIAYLSYHLNLGGKIVNVISYRPTSGNTCGGSLLLNITIPLREHYGMPSGGDDNTNTNIDLSTFEINTENGQLITKDGNDETVSAIKNKVVGWELNSQMKNGPKMCSLRHLLDERLLSIQATDLNLKLMKWRMIPSLDIDMLQSTKVLIIGAGTLGCSVSRTLLGWGIRHIKFIDYGYVSYSNPVRQFLFTLNDCKDNNTGGGNKKSSAADNGRPKAEAAADALHTIVADAHTEGITMSVPMPGHVMLPRNDKERNALKEDVDKLDRLVQECDVIFLLTDTRESRWLPTVMANVYDKVLINAAMGLDSWLVMRHGGSNCSSGGDERLGCYYCNDIVAPENSMKNRTLDQQCTVTRPGLSPITSSMAVEILISLLHHPRKQYARAPKQPSKLAANSGSEFSPAISSHDDSNNDHDPSTSPSTALGIIPHQIRGSIVTYTMMSPTVPAFQYCTGCSPSVIDEYKKDRLNLIINACSSSSSSNDYLEDLSGLAKFREEAQTKLNDIDLIDDDEDDDW